MIIKQSKETNNMIKTNISSLSIGSLKTIDYISTHNHHDKITGEIISSMPTNTLNCKLPQLRLNFKELQDAGFIKKTTYSRKDQTYYISTTSEFSQELENTHSTINIPDNILNNITGKVMYMIVRALYIHAHINAGTSKQNNTDIRFLYKDTYGKNMPDTATAYSNFYIRLKKTEETTGIQFTIKRNGTNPTAYTIYFTFPEEYKDTTRKQREYNQSTYKRLKTRLEEHDSTAAKEYKTKVKTDITAIRQTQPKEIKHDEPLPERIKKSPVLKAEYDSLIGLGFMTRAEIIEQLLK